jgi:hypothetical protein
MHSITIRGVHYPTQAAAARALGVSRQTVTSAVKAGRTEFIGLGYAPGAHRAPQPITVDGVQYRSLTAAAVATGYPHKRLRMFLNEGIPLVRRPRGRPPKVRSDAQAHSRVA